MEQQTLSLDLWVSGLSLGLWVVSGSLGCSGFLNYVRAGPWTKDQMISYLGKNTFGCGLVVLI